MSDDPKTWVTREGEEIELSDMHSYHLQNARRIIKPWSRHEADPARRADLQSWVRRLGREIRKRERNKRKQANGSA